MRTLRNIGLGIVLAIVSACSGGQERPSLNLEIINAAKSTIASRRAPKAERPPVTRALLNTLDGAFTEAVLERSGQLAYLFVSSSRREPTGHTLIVWRSEDNVTLTTRNDVLISTRGIGGDLISTDVAVDPLRAGPAGSGARRMVYLGGNNNGIRLTMSCEVSDAGPQTITIVGQTHHTRLYQERCTGGGGEIVNEYWIDAAAGLAWQTRQWAGPETGYIRFRRLTLG